MFEQGSLHERRILTKVERVQSSLAVRKDKTKYLREGTDLIMRDWGPKGDV